MSLSPAELRKLKDAFNEAVRNHPHPDEPVLYGPQGFSVRQLAKEVENETLIGQRVIRVIDDVVSSGAMTLDAVLAQMTARKPPRP